MRLTKIELRNWKNFVRAEAPLARRVFIAGGNGAGKSNLLDALRFLRDVANPVGGGLQAALARRGGIGQVRSYAARGAPTVKICIEAGANSSGDNNDNNGGGGGNGRAPRWRYELALRAESRGKRRTLVESERVERDGHPVLARPDRGDAADADRLLQTALEDVRANRAFRELAEFFQSFRYLHMVPQLARHAAEFQGQTLRDDPFGQGLMSALAALPRRTRQARLARLGAALHGLMPQMDPEVRFERDGRTGRPHLQARFKHWRRPGARQTEEQFSDGALRLLGLVWPLLEGRAVVMMEEPELSLNEGLVKLLPGLFAQAVLGRKKGVAAAQVIATTHSAALLEDRGIGGHEVLLLAPAAEAPVKVFPGGNGRARPGTGIFRVCDSPAMTAEMEAGHSVGDAALVRARPHDLVDL